MKIAQIAPLIEAVPPKLYGGIERVVHYLTEELVHMGHEVTLFASGDSQSSAELVPIVSQCLRMDLTAVNPLAYQVIQLKEVMRRAHEFDILHFHIDYLHFPWLEHSCIPHITTLHGTQDLPELTAVYQNFPNEKLVSISNSQRLPIPGANWADTIYHGLPINLHCAGTGESGYLAFLGRISPEKGIEQAIEIAIGAKVPLKIAAKIDKTEIEYYDQIKHLLNHPLIEYIGEINECQKTAFLGNARALVFPIHWAEPFGMVLIEAMSCGTPVIAFPMGSVPEIIQDGVTGFIVNNVKDGIEATGRVRQLNRYLIRQCFEQSFTAEKMARHYQKIYYQMIQQRRKSPGELQLIKPMKTNLGNLVADKTI